MNTQENNSILEREHNKIIDSALDDLCKILQRVEVLNTTLKENQIRKFRSEWFKVLNENLDSNVQFESTDFQNSCKYLFSRINNKNMIKEDIFKLTEETKAKLRLVE